MVTLDIRRHAEASKDTTSGSALSLDGLEMARRLSAAAPAYALVVCSPRPRTRDTAVVIAGRIDHSEQDLDVAEDSIITIDEYFALTSPEAVLSFLRDRPRAQDFVRMQFAVWKRLAASISDGQQGLIVAHGANVELPAVALAHDLGLTPPRVPVLYCEGVRVRYGALGAYETEPLTSD